MDRVTQYVNALIPHKTLQYKTATAYAPSNIALCKYWGKRDAELNLPNTSSLSLSLNLGTHTQLEYLDAAEDQIILNQTALDNSLPFCQKLIHFLNLFREPATHFRIETQNEIPTAAGLASSASGFAALTLALNQLYDWQVSQKTLSLLARLGSGSACRSIFTGFVEWHAGEKENGMDSFAEPLAIDWPTVHLGILLITATEKNISSREAMQKTVDHSPRYARWKAQVAGDLAEIKAALYTKDFQRLGEATERNAIAMHQTLWDIGISYDTEQTREIKNQVQQLRRNGIPIYFTQDAGSNIKLLYETSQQENVLAHFPQVQRAK